MIASRIEWLIDNTPTDEQQTVELLKMQRTLAHMSRLNRTLLLLTKIDNGLFPESVEVDIAAMAREQAEVCGEIYASHHLQVSVEAAEPLTETMNESLASTIVNNLVKNAFVHSADGAAIAVTADAARRTLRVANDGTAPLDADRIFDRFYQGSKREGSTGLGWPWPAPWHATTGCGSPTVSRAGGTYSRSCGHDRWIPYIKCGTRSGQKSDSGTKKIGFFLQEARKFRFVSESPRIFVSRN